ncbi:MAG: response regulator transcription factor [Chloroflexaceae bacterium]|nr:response regulator transcription factor [Chloroflexaceae bacterium]
MLPVVPTQITVLVADDHELTRFSLKAWLSSYSHITVVGVASNGREAVSQARYCCPDVIVLDLQMPVLDGLSAALEIKQFCPQTQIIAYTSLDDPQAEVMSQTAPIAVFCRKDIAAKHLLALIEKLGEEASAARSQTPVKTLPVSCG